MADWETRAVRSDGCRIAYDCRQGEGPEVVLLHGYGLDRTMWAPQLAALEGWTVLNLDIRGHGDSRPCADFSIPQAAEDLRAVLVKERCRAPVLVCRGERDRTGTIARHMEDWKRAWPETETAVLPGAAHVVNLDAPEAFNRLLLDFLTRCGGSRRGRR